MHLGSYTISINDHAIITIKVNYIYTSIAIKAIELEALAIFVSLSIFHIYDMHVILAAMDFNFHACNMLYI